MLSPHSFKMVAAKDFSRSVSKVILVFFDPD
jgi:hypothetical protein